MDTLPENARYGSRPHPVDDFPAHAEAPLMSRTKRLLVGGSILLAVLWTVIMIAVFADRRPDLPRSPSRAPLTFSGPQAPARFNSGQASIYANDLGRIVAADRSLDRCDTLSCAYDSITDRVRAIDHARRNIRIIASQLEENICGMYLQEYDRALLGYRDAIVRSFEHLDGSAADQRQARQGERDALNAFNGSWTVEQCMP
jgi:hypothetical protein